MEKPQSKPKLIQLTFFFSPLEGNVFQHVLMQLKLLPGGKNVILGGVGLKFIK